MKTIVTQIDSSLVVILSKKVSLPCKTINEARELCRYFIADNNLGGSSLFNKFGFVYHPTKGFICRISYNGRVWQNAKWNFNSENIELQESEYSKTVEQL